ncbi:hypothetical protein OH491_24050 [Termitidicoccus mucosus]|uniref:DUF4140 domain-containing protein n=1 Tax=Termitidicoccus mucosus TaxID=1184151 RepID=A0A178IQE7_9BACT|nr:hypothetical protein AW736_02420 [Opitutaceae bacterium TSB47]
MNFQIRVIFRVILAVAFCHAVLCRGADADIAASSSRPVIGSGGVLDDTAEVVLVSTGTVSAASGPVPAATVALAPDIPLERVLVRTRLKVALRYKAVVGEGVAAVSHVFDVLSPVYYDEADLVLEPEASQSLVGVSRQVAELLDDMDRLAARAEFLLEQMEYLYALGRPSRVFDEATGQRLGTGPFPAGKPGDSVSRVPPYLQRR